MSVPPSRIWASSGPDRHITVNLAPADVRKTGPVYDLPLLLAVLTASGQLEPLPQDTAFLGELALDGALRPVSGVLPMALAAAADGVRALYVPAENAAEAAEAGGDAMKVYPARTAREVVDALRGLSPSPPQFPSPSTPPRAGTMPRTLQTSWASPSPAEPWSLPPQAGTTCF